MLVYCASAAFKADCGVRKTSYPAFNLQLPYRSTKIILYLNLQTLQHAKTRNINMLKFLTLIKMSLWAP
jgi:hypothetical protein